VLCLVVGRGARRVSPDQAMDYVAGFTVMNDVSARDWQFAVSQWHRAKSADTFAPLGPALVTLDEASPEWGSNLRDGWPKLRLLCRVNGETLQDCLVGDDIIFGPAEVLSFISGSETLEAGDCISLGTPAGVGYYRRPQRYLKAGDVVECEIPGLGCLRNRVAAE
jgi:2-keto-4-pentenoate hydratase/2-oxohepta-3-ene-1,7-dioic acid hydratase in catechol pathway